MAIKIALYSTDNRNFNSKQFWKYANSSLKTRPSINSLKRDDNSTVDSDQDKCQLFNEFFSSVFTVEDCTSIPQLSDVCQSPLTTITITPSVMFDKLSQLNPTKVPGPEGWPLFCLKKCAEELSIPLSNLWRPQHYQTAGKKLW